MEKDQSGFLIINKPLHYSSMDVIRVLRKLTGIKKIGHAGTLDPLATGVLLVCIGRATTKHIDSLMNMEKEYIAEIDLTAFSETDDAEGPLQECDVKNIPSENEIIACLHKFIGLIEQIPPRYSAMKIQGVRAYKKVRSGEIFELEARMVEIKSIDLLSYQWPVLKIKVTCGKGVYIRSLARDIGNCLHTGGYLKSLIRSRIGEYRLENALELKFLQENTNLIEEKLSKI
ncbi:TPA: tRNA pseudouridine(55) synthase TruB [Candidatus Dependentiae bacterium]|nr:MAG: tRNA pseudouridine synthase B [candidate division TM6 bacterium GW2011_GWF2_36_131]KKQ03348.1 MAG: tRNA pseudouridine synthase B [candidate division TM6 bacterium GW2011_GWE2_36_25]KKQ19744.1 MAG: tRNA pseudouridine synthase B [candidate division TM6 bacterium GW2011_GWA2_36_9]HBR70874.1 tRNA pseudouridine(55) synthase TruB [Candidatus Dependentiae bacterium]HCU00523.1 tRNA pseudouridine(55) synthase TruB [Candidatus Dependentiae bacterium]